MIFYNLSVFFRKKFELMRPLQRYEPQNGKPENMHGSTAGSHCVKSPRQLKKEEYIIFVQHHNRLGIKLRCYFTPSAIYLL